MRFQEEIVKRGAFRKRLENGEENTGTPRGFKGTSGAASCLIHEIKKTMVDGKEQACHQLDLFSDDVGWALPGRKKARVSHNW